MTVYSDAVAEHIPWNTSTGMFTEGVSLGLTGIHYVGPPVYEETIVDSRWAVRALVPGDNTDTITTPPIIGQMEIGASEITGLEWLYLTSVCEGLSYTVGGGPGEFFEAGELNMRIQNDENFSFSPWRNAFYGPGTLVQVVVSVTTYAGAGLGVGGSDYNVFTYSQGVWFTTSWVEANAEIGVHNWIDITGIEPFGLLAQIQTPAVTAQGLNDSALLRLITLWLESNYPFSYNANIESVPYNCYSTTLEDNRMVELRKLAQTFNAQIHSGKDGNLRMIGRGREVVDNDSTWSDSDSALSPNSDGQGNPIMPGVLNDAPYITGTLRTANDDKLLLSELTLKQDSGSSYVTYEQSFGTRYQKRALQILDLVFRDNYSDADLDWLADKILLRGTVTYRPESLDMTSLQGEKVIRYLLGAEVGQMATIYGEQIRDEGLDEGEWPYHITFYGFSICRISHYIRPMAETLVWDATLEFDVEAESSTSVYLTG